MKKDVEMPFLEHLRELRGALIRTFIGIALGTSIALFWSEQIFSVLIAPLLNYFPKVSLIGTGPTDAFMTKLFTGIAGGVLVSLPFTFLQLWGFIAPGLYEKEKRLVLPFVAFSTVCFIGGGYFCYTLVLPVAFEFFGGEFESIRVEPQIRIGEYFSFTLKMLVVFGCIFELPIITYFLARGGLVSHKWLLGRVRHAVVIIFIIAGVLTPPDVISQMLMAGPLLVIYAICIGVAYFANPARLQPEVPL